MDLLVETGDAGKGGRSDLTDRFGDHRRGAVGPGDAALHVGISADAFEHVAQREKLQSLVIFVQQHPGQNGLDVGREVPVTEHHTLGTARRARCVDDRRQIVGIDLRGPFPETVPVSGIPMRPDDVVELQHPARRLAFDLDDHGKIRKFLPVIKDLPGLNGVLRHDDSRTGVHDVIGDRGRGQCRVDRHVDRPERQRRNIDLVPLRTVVRQQGDPISPPDTQSGESLRQGRRRLEEGVGGHRSCPGDRDVPVVVVTRPAEFVAIHLKDRRSGHGAPPSHSPIQMCNAAPRVTSRIAASLKFP